MEMTQVVILAIKSVLHRSHFARRLVTLLVACVGLLAVRTSRKKSESKKTLRFQAHSPSPLALQASDSGDESDSNHSETDQLETDEPVERLEAEVVKNKVFGLPEDRFELGEKVSVGSQGIVYNCTRLNTQEKFAAKVINCCSLEDTKKKIMLLKREICIMRELHHPKIVNILAAFWGKDSCTIVMDLALGGDLYKLLENEVAEARERNQIFNGLGGNEKVSQDIAHQLLDGIRYMHLNHVVHRDLKLENILITETRPVVDLDISALHRVKIADFGLSTVLNSIGGKFCSSLHMQMSAVGTPAYVAPEVLDEKYDLRVDFWSFGVVLYAMLCGQMPFNISSLRPDKHKICVSKIQENDSWQLASREAKSMIRGLLHVNPKRRLTYSTCRSHPFLATEEETFQRQFSPASPGFPVKVRFQRQNSPFASSERQHSHGSSVPDSVASDGERDGATVGVVSHIVGMTGSTVHRAELTLVNEELLDYGDDEEQTPWSSESREQNSSGDHVAECSVFELDADEIIIGVMQAPSRDAIFSSSNAHLGDALVFYTSASRILGLQGSDARRRHRFVAPKGWQIMGLQFDGNVLIGVCVERAPPGGEGSVAEISGRASAIVDQAKFKLRNGTCYTYGTDNGHEQGPWKLKPQERIVIVEQGYRDQSLGVSLAFYTSLGNVFKLAGVSGTRSKRFAAPSGSQVCGLRFESGVLTGVQTCSLAGDLGNTSWRDVM